MALPLIVLPLGIAGLALLGEHLKAKRSRWGVLAAKYPGTKSEELDWTRLPGMDVEYREGRTLYRVSYAHTRDRRQSALERALWQKLFPLGHVAVSPKGLHFKRPAWHFKHPPLMIPWSKIADIKTMKTSELATNRVARQTGIAAEKFKVPKLMSTVLDGISPEWACVTLADPKMTITLTADTIADAFQYVSKPESVTASAPTPVPVAATAAAPTPVRNPTAGSRAPVRSAKPAPPPARPTPASRAESGPVPARPTPASTQPRANPLEHLLPGGGGMALMRELTTALIAYTPERFDVISCTIKEGTENGQQALVYDIRCPRFPDEGTTAVNERVHTAATRLVQQMSSAKGAFPGLTVRLEKQEDGRWRSQVKLLAA